MANASGTHQVNSFPSKVASDRAPTGLDLRKIATPILTHLLSRDKRFPSRQRAIGLFPATSLFE